MDPKNLWNTLFSRLSPIEIGPTAPGHGGQNASVASVTFLHATTREHSSLPVSTFQKKAMDAPNTIAVVATRALAPAPAAPAPSVQVPYGQVDLVDFID
jgi:hypothetical protein